MSFYQKLRYATKIPEEKKEMLPRSYQIVGKILLLKLKPELYRYRKIIGKTIFEILPYLQSVCLIKEISEKTRKPKIEVLAGSGTKTIHKEHDCFFAIDVSKLMFSKGNKHEKIKLLEKVKNRETIIDMFSGIGYWSILLAKNRNIKIYAIDMNPEAVRYLKKNIELNKLSGRIFVSEGNCINFAETLSGKADRIIMGYLFETEQFLPTAIKMAKKNCIVHFHRNIEIEKITELEKSIKEIGKRNGAEIKIPEARKIKSYAPGIWHIVLDLKIRK